MTIPAWVKDSIFYQIFPDRFALTKKNISFNLEPWDTPPSTQGYKGGDLWGIVEHLDYIVDLGITALYLNPIFQATSNHRYNTQDYLHVDPMLGGDQAFHTLLEESHRNGIKVILDGVFNHTGRGFLPFADIMDNGPNSAWLDWYKIKGWPIFPFDSDKPANYSAWHNVREMPQLNLNNADVREYIYQVAEYWLYQGIDGWRIDSPESVDDINFWVEFRRRIKKINPEAYIIGEIWQDPEKWLANNMFDATTNYSFTGTTIAYVASGRVQSNLLTAPNPVRDYYPYPPLTAEGFSRQIESQLSSLPIEFIYAQFNILNSHDTPRMLTLVQNDIPSVELATLYQMTSPGVPCILYGDEIGIPGGPDPDCRRTFPWNDQTSWNFELLSYFKKVIKARHSYPSLRQGSYIRFYAQAHVYAFARNLNDETVIVIINSGDDPAFTSLAVGNYFRDGDYLVGYLHGDVFEVKQGHIGIEIPGRRGEILVNKKMD